MNKLTIITATVGALAAATLGSAGAAAATSFGGSSVSDTVNSLRADGYDVQLNGVADVPLDRCTVTSVYGLPKSAPVGGQAAPPGGLTTVYVDFWCPEDI